MSPEDIDIAIKQNSDNKFKEISVSADDMAHCANEPIHLLNQTQSFGITLVCDPLSCEIIAYSSNAVTLLGKSIASLKGTKVQDLFEVEPTIIWSRVLKNAKSVSAIMIGSVIAIDSSQQMEVNIHREPKSKLSVIELIPINPAFEQKNNGNIFLTELTESLQLFKDTDSLEQFSTKSTDLVQRFTGYDRVMLYRFKEDWSGEIVAESTAKGVEARFKGQHFPESDIPIQARSMFELNPIRIIADTFQEPNSILSNSSQAIICDQSYALLRQPSEMHIIYLKNMGVKASLTISLSFDNKLWGLLSCHHNSPKLPLGKQREPLLLACKLMSFALTSQVTSLIKIKKFEKEREEALLLKKLSEQLSNNFNLAENWRGIQSELQYYFKSTLISLFHNDVWYSPPDTTTENLLKILSISMRDSETIIESLQNEGMPASTFDKLNISGFVSQKIPNVNNSYLIIFRPEYKKVKTWGGKPGLATPVASSDGKIMLGPRSSFDKWVETTRGKCKSFSKNELSFSKNISRMIGEFTLAHYLKDSQAKLALLGSGLDHISDLVIVTDNQTNNPLMTYVNQTVIKHSGYRKDELIGKNPAIFQGLLTDKDKLYEVSQALKKQIPVRVTIINYTKSQKPYWIEVSIVPIFNDQQICTNFLSVQRDVSEQIKKQRELASLSQDLEVTLKIIPDYILEFDTDETLNRINHKPEFISYSGEGNIIGKKLSQLFPIEISAIYKKTFNTAKSNSFARNIEYQQKIGGHLKHYDLSVSIKYSQDKISSGYVCVVRDITSKKHSDDQIAELAYFDPLTGLNNRRALQDRLKETTSRCNRSGKFFALLYLDLDHFKQLNDTKGHSTGDILLKQVAKRLGICTRQDDFLARMGGDEFVIIVESFDNADDARKKSANIARKLCDSIKEPYDLGSIVYLLTASIGITIDGGAEVMRGEDLLKQADLAMYRSKKMGGACWSFFESEIETQVSSQAELEQDLRSAIEGNHLEIHFQPIVSDGKEISGFEALSRWKHPVKGYIPPDIFIPLAEESQLIIQQGDWVLTESCRVLASWANNPKTSNWKLSVNISARQIVQDKFVDRLTKIITLTGANPKQLELELTESLLQDNIEATIDIITSLNRLGIRFSLDDFGTGYSSLSYLKRLPIDRLKIDKSFVDDILTNTDDTAIAKMIIDLANSMRREVVAEGVETESQLSFLRQMGCDYYQGYFIAKPMPLENINKWSDDYINNAEVGGSRPPIATI